MIGRTGSTAVSLWISSAQISVTSEPPVNRYPNKTCGCYMPLLSFLQLKSSDGVVPLKNVDRGPENFSLYSHGVNNAVALKWAAVWSEVYGDNPEADWQSMWGTTYGFAYVWIVPQREFGG